MPEEAEVLVETPMAKEIAAKTTTAIKEIGLDPELEAEFTSALAKDDAKKGDKAPPADAPATQQQEKTPAKTEPKAKAPPKEEAIPDIPDALLEPKKDVAPQKAVTDDDREKFIAEQTKGLSPKAADRFRNLERLKHEAEQRASKLPDLEKKLAELNDQLKARDDTSEREALKKRVEELDAALKKTALTEHPGFKARYDGEIAKQIEKAKAAVGEERAAEVEYLLSLPSSKVRNTRLGEILSELEDKKYEFVNFSNAMLEVDALSSKKAAELANWKENATHLERQEQEKQQKALAEREQQIEQAFSHVQKRFGDEKNGIELFRKLDGQDEWNGQVDDRFKKVQNILKAQGLTAQDMAEMAAWAVAGNEYRTRFLVQRALVKKLQDEIASLRGGEPEIGEGQVAETEYVPGNGIDAIVQAAQKAGLVR